MSDPDGTFEERISAIEAEDPGLALDVFWKTRPALEHFRDFARARRVSPWAVLGVALARVVCATKPFVQLPATIGSHASLNLFVGLVGPSGAGKDAATKVARDAFDVGHGFTTAPLGSGEGLSHMFMKETKEGPEQYNDAALVTVGEIDTLTALSQRRSSTVGAQLRQAAMGEQLGFFYVDTSKRMIVPEHCYRLCLVAGVQPLRARSLLEESDGGTPQRFVWLPAIDPEAPDVAPSCPPPMVWEPPQWNRVRGERSAGQDRVVMEICDAARDTIVAAHLARTRGEEDETLNGHALLTRLKVAAALALLQGRPDVVSEDWELSEVIMTVSDRTRGSVVESLAQENRQRTKAQAEAEATKTIVVDERLEEHHLRRVGRLLSRKLAAGSMTHIELRRALASRDRGYLEAALDHLLAAGVIASEELTHDAAGHGGKGTRYRSVGTE
jgi:hypothetical protein